ncbi:response regulator [Amycolatopsis australiensis]|uniref:DNA-binding response regulator, NarL/FixJ family, contains REC and HTH domains n=1 Tax=Amycolatopsis australiensis TaxID=546364 RepID=A0A1K1SSP7_9PSEU|nr:response regulator [Amycolatopsis australiensis]SFW87337.1 DNA-binding response regulator, NarL/FixJ family, contains REC and HTH domains [Amycolatopsis australiensis]
MRIVIAEEDTLLREGLVLLLRSEGFHVVAAVDHPGDLVAEAGAQAPDLAVVDVRMPPTFTDEGLRAALEARRRQPGLAILALSAFVEDGYAGDLLAAGGGGAGYLLKERVGKPDEFLDALRRVAAGGTVLDRDVVAAQLARRRPGDPVATLTAREREVVALLAEGHSVPTIGRLLGIGTDAARKHAGDVSAKLRVPGEAQSMLSWLRA